MATKKDPNGRFSKVYRKMWLDDGFQSLSPIPPCGQGLWLYLLTSPKLAALPGLILSSEIDLANGLKWSLEDLRKVFDELLVAYPDEYPVGYPVDMKDGNGVAIPPPTLKAMVKVSWEHNLVWVPNAIQFNRPESSNVVLGWSTFWNEVPECYLKLEAYYRLRHSISGMHQDYQDAFIKACPMPTLRARRLTTRLPTGLPSGLSKGLPTSEATPMASRYQEHEHEQASNQPKALIESGGAGGDDTAAPGTSSTATRLPAKRLRPPGQDQPATGFDPAAIPLPNFIPRELWRQWCEDRKKRKKPITEEAARLQLERLTGWHNAGLDAAASIRNSIEAGYQGLFEPKGPRPNGAHGTPPGPAPRRELSLEEKLERDGM